MQPDLFEQTAYGDVAPSQRHSPTSVEAAKSIEPRLPELRQRVYDFIASQEDGATDMEIASALAMLTDTARARRCELVDAGLIRDSGKTRPSPRGRKSAVWIVAGKCFERG